MIIDYFLFIMIMSSAIFNGKEKYKKNIASGGPWDSRQIKN